VSLGGLTAQGAIAAVEVDGPTRELLGELGDDPHETRLEQLDAWHPLPGRGARIRLVREDAWGSGALRPREDAEPLERALGERAVAAEQHEGRLLAAVAPHDRRALLALPLRDRLRRGRQRVPERDERLARKRRTRRACAATTAAGRAEQLGRKVGVEAAEPRWHPALGDGERVGGERDRRRRLAEARRELLVMANEPVRAIALSAERKGGARASKPREPKVALASRGLQRKTKGLCVPVVVGPLDGERVPKVAAPVTPRSAAIGGERGRGGSARIAEGGEQRELGGLIEPQRERALLRRLPGHPSMWRLGPRLGRRGDRDRERGAEDATEAGAEGASGHRAS